MKPPQKEKEQSNMMRCTAEAWVDVTDLIIGG